MYIVDTNVLMSNASFEGFLEKCSDVRIPVEVLYELDNLKTSPGERGFKARRAIRNVEKHFNEFKFLQHTGEDIYSNMNFIPVDDIIIGYCKENKKSILITNDISMKIKAAAVGVLTMTYQEKDEIPECLTDVNMTDEEFDVFKANPVNIWDILPGQFLCVRNSKTTEIREIRKFLGENFFWENVELNTKISNYLFSVTPKDEYQACAMHSLIEDEFTVIVGPAGTGKTLLSLAYCLKMIKDKGAKIHVFVNPVKTRDSEALGFYPGNRDEKLLQNFIGAILSNKIGDMIEVNTLMAAGYLNIYPFSDIRGIEIAKDDIMYITEAQNLSVDLIKLAIQRCAEGSKIIIEGDPFTQVDKEAFQDGSNGLKRVIKVFGGDPVIDFSFIQLPNIYRSHIANKAEEL